MLVSLRLLAWVSSGWPACCRGGGGTLPGFVAVFGFLSAKVVPKWIGYAYVDLGLGFFVTASLAAMVLWQRTRPHGAPWLWLAGIFAGCAAGTKVFGLMAMLPIAAWLVVDSRRIRPVATFLGLAFLSGGYWYVRSYWYTGNPFHPVGSSLFGYYLWSPEDLALQFAEQGEHGQPKTLANFLTAAVTDKVRAYALVVGLLAAVHWRKMPPELRFLWFFATAYYTGWFFISQVDRYIMPALPAGCVLAAWLLREFAIDWRRNSAKLPEESLGRWASRLVLLLSCVWFGDKAIQYGTRLEKGFAATRISHNRAYLPMRAADHHRSEYGNTLVQIGLEDGNYFFRGLTVGERFGPGRYSQWREPGVKRKHCGIVLVGPGAMADSLRGYGARLLAIRRDAVCLDEAAMQGPFQLLYKDEYSLVYGLREVEAESR
jgi:hypothetical protein